MANKSIGLLNIVFGADLRGFDRAMKKAQKSIKKFGSSMKRTGANLTRNLTMPLVALGVVGVRAFDKQQKAIAQVEAGLKSTGNQVGKTSKELQKMAADLQKTTLFGDEEILQGATAQLLTFTNIAGKQFERTQEIALDLATRLDGDLKSASIMLGKALNDPVANLSALSRAGIQFSKDQKETIKSLVETNRLADAQTIILAELEKQYGGSAAAAAKAGLGPIQQLGNSLSDMSEDIGMILLPTIQDLANWIKKIADKFDGLDDSTKKNIVKWGLIVGAIGPAIFIFGQLAIAVSALIPIFTTLGAIMIANPIGLLITAVGALVGAFYWLMTSTSDTARVIKNGFVFMANSIIASVNAIIKGLNMINPFKQIPLIEQFTYITKTKLEEVGDAAKDAAKEITNLAKGLQGGGGTTGKGKGLTAIPSFGPALIPVEGGGPMGSVGAGIADITRKQKELNATTALFRDIMHNAMMDAADSQEGFFQSLFENLRKAIRQMLIQLAVLTAINIMLGGKGITGVEAFANAKNSLLGLANGGLATGPTMALIGEGSGTSISNPEVVAPLDKLKNYMGGDMRVTGRLVGNDIFLSNEKAGVSRNRFV